MFFDRDNRPLAERAKCFIIIIYYWPVWYTICFSWALYTISKLFLFRGKSTWSWCLFEVFMFTGQASSSTKLQVIIRISHVHVTVYSITKCALQVKKRLKSSSQILATAMKRAVFPVSSPPHHRILTLESSLQLLHVTRFIQTGSVGRVAAFEVRTWTRDRLLCI